MLKQTSAKGHLVNILSFAGRIISVATTRLCHDGLEAVIRTCKRMGMAMFQRNFMEIQISCSFHMSQNILLLIFLI